MSTLLLQADTHHADIYVPPFSFFFLSHLCPASVVDPIPTTRPDTHHNQHHHAHTTQQVTVVNVHQILLVQVVTIGN